MTRQEVQKETTLPLDTIKEYEQIGLLRLKAGSSHYLDSDIQHLGIIDTLLEAGFTPVEAKGYFDAETFENGKTQQIRMLRQKRKLLLDTIHSKQKALDHIDFIIWEKGRGG